MDQIKDRLKEWRNQKGLKQRDVAEALKVNVGLVGSWECGRQRVPDYRIDQICTKFGVNRDWLERGEGEMFEPEIEPETPSFEDEMYKMYQQLSPEYQEVWKNLAELILNGKPTDEKIEESVIPKKNVNVNASITGNHNTQEVHVK